LNFTAFVVSGVVVLAYYGFVVVRARRKHDSKGARS
jgi:hypothetical protein